MSKPRILVQLDADPQASVFDSVVAIDAGVDQLLQYHGVQPEQVQSLVHGAMFTRGSQDLRSTAIFVGGSDVAAAETLLDRVQQCFFGPMRVSVLFDANGANTTAAAAVLAAARHVDLGNATALVLGGTGPVGQRAARLLASAGCAVRVGSRSRERAKRVCDSVSRSLENAHLTACETSSPQHTTHAIDGTSVVIAAGAAGVEVLPIDLWQTCPSLRVAIDLNAVPPSGIGGLEMTDKGEVRGKVVCYGAVGVGGTKMKIHKAAVARLFDSNDQVLDAEEVLAIGQQLEGG
jgi:hypothetical protein